MEGWSIRNRPALLGIRKDFNLKAAASSADELTLNHSSACLNDKPDYEKVLSKSFKEVLWFWHLARLAEGVALKRIFSKSLNNHNGEPSFRNPSKGIHREIESLKIVA